MTTLQDRPNTALVVIDMQNGVVAGAHERNAVVANIGSLVERARREHGPVVWVRHSDNGLVRESEECQLVPELTPDPAEPLVRGYDATRVTDAHTTEDNSAWDPPPPAQIITHTNLYRTYETAPGRKGGTASTVDVDLTGTPSRTPRGGR